MNSQEREPPSSSSRGGGGGGGGGGGDRRAERKADGDLPSSGAAANNVSSATVTTASDSTNPNKTMPTNPTTTNQQSQRSSSTESEGVGRRDYMAKDRRAPPPRHSDDDDELDAEDEEEDEAEEMEEGRTGSDSSSGGGGNSGSDPSNTSSSAPHPSHGSSSTSGSPVRRLPQMLRAPMNQPPSSSVQQQQQQQQQQAPAMYGNHSAGIAQQARPSMPHYYGTASPRDPTSMSAGAAVDGGRVLAQKRRLQQAPNEYMSPTSPSLPPPHPQSQPPPLNPSTRALYEASQHHSSSNSSSSTARSGGGVGLVMNNSNHHHHVNAHANHHRGDDDDDDDQDDPLRFETRGSHGPRDEARYETWTSKQLRKKCSHLKLRGLKNVKKHVMVEALYRYYRNQRGKTTGNDVGAGSSNASANANTMRGSSSSMTHSNASGGRGAASSRNDSSAMYDDERYDQPPHRYDMNASSGSPYGSMGMRGSRPSMAAGNVSGSLNANMQPQARRSAPPSISQSTRQPLRHSSGGTSLPGGAYSSAMDVEESKYDGHENEVRITSEDVIRLVDVILSPEFVDRLSSELSRWQFWVDVREKYISLVAMNGPSSYGAARGLTALGGEHHSQSERGGVGSNSGVDSLRITSGYMRPSAKWSSMQLWEMWKELTFAYTKTCFEFTAAGMRSVDERNYIQFCEGRPDVYYLHQRLHARPDLLHLIKSNEYIEEKCSSDAASEHTNMNAEKNAANALMGVGSPVTQPRPHKRFKRIVPAGSNGGDRQTVGGSGGVTAGQAYASGGAAATGSYGNGNGGSGSGGMAVGTGTASGGNAGGNANTSSSDGATPPQIVASNSSGCVSGGSGSGGSGSGGPSQYLAANGMRVGTTISPSGQQEEGSTENSETTGEEGSLEKSNSNATSDSTRREALAEQKYFGLLLQNFEAIFESLHNKKVLLAALRKDNSAPDHLIADLHDDIHVLSALKKDFRNKLRQALE